MLRAGEWCVLAASLAACAERALPLPEGERAAPAVDPARVVDLAVAPVGEDAPDLAAARDLAAPSDLAVPRDLAAPRDLALLPDAARAPVDDACPLCPVRSHAFTRNLRVISTI